MKRTIILKSGERMNKLGIFTKFWDFFPDEIFEKQKKPIEYASSLIYETFLKKSLKISLDVKILEENSPEGEARALPPIEQKKVICDYKGECGNRSGDECTLSTYCCGQRK